MTYRSKMPPETVCIPHIYEDDDGRWWRVCFTCDDGSNKFGRHPRGHKTEADARMSFRDHARQMKANRENYARAMAWRRQVIAATTWDEFSRLWHERHPSIGIMPETPERIELMRDIQQRWRESDDRHATMDGVRAVSSTV